MIPDGEPFQFHTERRLVMLTGLKAMNLVELLALLRDVPGSSIFYHTHHLFLSHHFEKPTVHNEFANWVGQALQEDALAERLAAVDLMSYTSIRQLRDDLVATVDAHIRAPGTKVRDCRPGSEFHFCRSKSFIMPTGIVAHDVPDFFAKLPSVSNISLFFHFVESRIRLERPVSDFSVWLTERGHPALAKAIDRLDPYAVTLDELKQQILDIGNSHDLH